MHPINRLPDDHKPEIEWLVDPGEQFRGNTERNDVPGLQYIGKAWSFEDVEDGFSVYWSERTKSYGRLIDGDFVKIKVHPSF